VEFTSGAADGPELDEAYRDLDDNFYATLLAPARLTDLAEAMHGAGWRVRKCSWSEYEASCAWAELLLAPSGNISGVAAPGHRGRLLALVGELGFECRADPEERDAGPAT
jgi:hypothetical protein